MKEIIISSIKGLGKSGHPQKKKKKKMKLNIYYTYTHQKKKKLTQNR